ncbi:DUF1360 domain-containing protein [Bacillus sp. DX1.1]|uniref:DUF1360 domain-containing protein n=1 Tax=unclassified Bacillus (in: firmicutes) TaxID=185979 RepID=UPI0025706043|nr:MULTISPECIES: DUF1360 domain-containing protein [unclassified Bacillus (in: firmicutes)]MDM5153864.1 DUF1360 domain-containing protein [Bacillus sp. DX1.1]WJE82799.1 DUF1360 domain-containing protein [Bacillus sp. DX3.1]
MLLDSWLLFAVFSCAAFRLTRLIVYDKITSFLRTPFIEELQIGESDGTVTTYTKVKGKGLQKWIGELLSCYWCTGVWVSALLLLLYYWIPKVAEPLILLLAIAGVAAIIETVIGRFIE